MKREEITLDIDVFTPATLPMARFAQYVAQFAELLGNEANVHFSRIAKGSTKCKAFADVQVAPKVRERVQSVIDGGGSVRMKVSIPSNPAVPLATLLRWLRSGGSSSQKFSTESKPRRLAQRYLLTPDDQLAVPVFGACTTHSFDLIKNTRKLLTRNGPGWQCTRLWSL